MRILVVGGGIAGFFMAKALERKGYQADLVECRPDEASDDSGLFLPGNAGRALDQLGLLDRVQRVAAIISTQRILDKNGRQLSVTQTLDVRRSCGPCLSLPRAGLHGILRQSLSQTHLRFGVSVVAIERSATTCQVSFSDGSAATYVIVIGADGIGSTVRGLCSQRSNRPTSAMSAGVSSRVIPPALKAGQRCWVTARPCSPSR